MLDSVLSALAPCPWDACDPAIDGGDFGAAVAAVRQVSHRPVVLIGEVEDLKAGLENLGADETPLLCHATADNWQDMAALAIDVLPQVISVEAQSLLPGLGNNPGGPTTSIVLCFLPN